MLTLEGRTQSNARVSAYMRNLETSGWMTNPELSIIEARDPEKDKDGKAGPLADIKALPYVFVVKVKLPAQSEEVSATPGLNADGSVATAAPAPVAPLAQARMPQRLRHRRRDSRQHLLRPLPGCRTVGRSGQAEPAGRSGPGTCPEA